MTVFQTLHHPTPAGITAQVGELTTFCYLDRQCDETLDLKPELASCWELGARNTASAHLRISPWKTELEYDPRIVANEFTHTAPHAQKALKAKQTVWF